MHSRFDLGPYEPCVDVLQWLWEATRMAKCDYCGKEFFAGDGAWGNGDYTCPTCLAAQIEESEQKESLLKNSGVRPPPDPKKKPA
jgi:hypothetical protein